MLFQGTLSNSSLSCQDNLSVCKEASNDNRKLIQLLQLSNKVYMCTVCKTPVNIVTVNHIPVAEYDLNIEASSLHIQNYAIMCRFKRSVYVTSYKLFCTQH